MEIKRLPTNHSYLGDGVYFSFAAWQYVIAVGDQMNAVVYFEPEVFLSFVRAVVKAQPDMAARITSTMESINETQKFVERDGDLLR